MSFTFGNLNFEAVVFLPICADKQAKHNESLVERQMIKVLARPTNNVEQFCGQRRGGKFKCQHFTKFCSGLHEIFGFHEFNTCFIICFNVVELILFCQNL